MATTFPHSGNGYRHQSDSSPDLEFYSPFAGEATQPGYEQQVPNDYEEELSTEAFLPDIGKTVNKLFNTVNSILFSNSNILRTWGASDLILKHIEHLTYKELPALNNKPVTQLTKSEKQVFEQTWKRVRKTLTDQRRNLVTSGFIPMLGGAKVPYGFIETKGKGLRPQTSILSNDRLDKVLAQLFTSGKIRITQDQLDLFQRIANVETSGQVQTLNTWDSALVSIGFMQFTMHVGKLQEWIRLTPAAFRKYGIELDPSAKYSFGSNQFDGIKSVPDASKNDLRWNGWAERFYYAGLDEDVIIAEVSLAITYLGKHLKDLKARLNNNALYNDFEQNFYNRDPYIRGLFQASHNNHPTNSAKSVHAVMASFGTSKPSLAQFTEKYKDVLKAAGWNRLVDVTANGTNETLTIINHEIEWDQDEIWNETFEGEQPIEDSFSSFEFDENENFSPADEYEAESYNFQMEEEVLLEQEAISSSYAKQSGAASFASFLSPSKNAKATLSNATALSKSGLSATAVLSSLERYLNKAAIRQALLQYNQSNPSVTYKVETAGSVDAVFTEALHQFQAANYIDPKQHDGILGRSTLETLGFIEHGLKQKLSSAGFYGQKQLNSAPIKNGVPIHSNNEFNANNWYQFILKPSWLGIPISDGIHLALLRKLREAETWLFNQPQYAGMTPAALGKALGFTASTHYSGARLSATKQAMHGFGLALDIHVIGNPWIGAGWTQSTERKRMLDVLKKASGNNLPGENVLAYLHSLAVTMGNDTAKIYTTLQQRHTEFIAYLKNNPAELQFWKISLTFGNRNPLNGFLNMHPDLVYALRQVAGLAWGAVDFGPGANGDIMHFDLRTIGIAKFLCTHIGGHVPKPGNHPAIKLEAKENEMYESENEENSDELELHEAIEEAWTEEEKELHEIVE